VIGRSVTRKTPRAKKRVSVSQRNTTQYNATHLPTYARLALLGFAAAAAAAAAAAVGKAAVTRGPIPMWQTIDSEETEWMSLNHFWRNDKRCA